MNVDNSDEELFNKSIKSVLAQNFEEFELIILNNGNMKNALVSYSDNRINYIELTDKTTTGAIKNEGLKIANGEYLFFLDSSDWIEPDALKKIYEKAKELNLDVLIFNAVSYNNGRKSILCRDYGLLFDVNNFYVPQDSQIINNLFNIDPTICNKLFRKDFLIQNNLFFAENLTFEDIYFNHKTILNANHIGFLADFLCHYNREIRESRNLNYKEKQFDIIEIYKLIENHLVQKELFEKAKIDFYNNKLSFIKELYQKINPELKDKFNTLIKDDLKNTNLIRSEFVQLERYNEFMKYLIEIKS